MSKRTKQRPFDWSQTFNGASGQIASHVERGGNREYVWYDGIVRTPLGYVVVYAEPKFAQFRAMLHGREYAWSCKKSFTRLGLTTVAHRFIRSLYEWAGERV